MLNNEEVTEISLEQVDKINDLESNLSNDEILENIESAENSNNSINFDNLENLSVKQLQDILRDNKLKVKGRKDELIDRIKDFFSVEKL